MATFFLLLPFLLVSSAVPATDAGDRKALLAFKSQLAPDPRTTLALLTWDGSGCANWTGVARDPLSGRDLSSPIPSWLGSLTDLKTLDLRRSRIRGPLPLERDLSNLSKLEELFTG